MIYIYIQASGGHYTYEPSLANGQCGEEDEVDGMGSSNQCSAACKQEEQDKSQEEGDSPGDPFEFDDALVEVLK